MPCPSSLPFTVLAATADVATLLMYPCIDVGKQTMSGLRGEARRCRRVLTTLKVAVHSLDGSPHYLNTVVRTWQPTCTNGNGPD